MGGLQYLTKQKPWYEEQEYKVEKLKHKKLEVI